MLGRIKNKKILAIGPHPDDLEIGCFGTLIKLVRYNEVNLLVLTKGEQKDKNNTRVKEMKDAADLIKAKLIICDFKDGFIRDDLNCVKILEEYINKINPDIIFTINGKDTNQDHRYCFNATIAATRCRKNIFVYDSGSSTSFSPTLFIDITKYIPLKIEAILMHKSQFNKIIIEPIKGHAKSYALKLREPENYFEGFEVFRCVL